MFYFDIWEGVLPTWVPLWGGDYASFWPIFNFADASIFVGVVIILFNQKKFLDEPAVAGALPIDTTSNQTI
jgi:signal peptidase II